jgi:hypothetical protein
MKLPEIKIPDVGNAGVKLVSDLKARRLLPALGVIVVALIAIPLLLSKGADTQSPDLPPPPVVHIGTARPVVGHVRHPSRGTNFLAGPAHDPFVAPPAVRQASSKAGGATKVTTKAQKTASSARTKKVAAHTKVTSGSKPVKVVTRSLPKVYVSYRPQLLFGAANKPLTSYVNPPRDSEFVQSKGLVLLYLGLEKNARTVVFLVPNGTTVAGKGECSPSTSNCRYLLMRPGDNVTLTSQPSGQTASEYALHYRSVHERRSHHHYTLWYSKPGLGIVLWSSSFLKPLRSLSYTAAAGLLTIHLGSLAPAPKTSELRTSSAAGTTTTSTTSTTG